MLASLVGVTPIGGPQGQARGVTITLTKPIVFGDDDGPGAFATIPGVFMQTPIGDYLIGEVNGIPLLFDSTGRFRRAAGRRGQGPGEFTGYVGQAVPFGDSILLGSNGRIGVFSRELRFGRYLDVAGGRPSAMLEVGSSLVVARGAPMAPVTNWLAVVDRSGRVGREMAPHAVRGYACCPPRLGPADGRTFWATGRPDSSIHLLTRWSLDGDQLGKIDRTPPWWVDRNDAGRRSSIVGVAQVDSVVWVASISPRADYRPPPAPPGVRGVSMASMPVEEIYETWIEVYDARSLALLAERRTDGYAAGLLTDGRLVRYVVDGSGIAHVEVIRLGLAIDRKD